MIAGLLFVCQSVLFAQSVRITGSVTEQGIGTPLPFVGILVKGTTIGTSTLNNGTYAITAPVNGTLVFSIIGYKTMEIPISGKTTINISMEQNALALEDVLVVAYGTAKKGSFTGSAAVVDRDKLLVRSVASVTKALDGVATGVQSTLGSGQPGSGAAIVIRGFGSINASTSPLYVVDGVPYDGNINSINPNDIESITILKDASAGALFGSRGANGVIMITTRAGKDTEGKITVNFKSVMGVASRAIPRYNILNQSEYLETAFQSYKNDEIYSKGVPAAQAALNAINRMKGTTDGILGVNEQYNPYDMPLSQLIDPLTGKVNSAAKLKWNDNWLDEATAKNPIRQEYQLDISGGNKVTKAMASINYLKEDGLLKTTSFDRFTGRLAVDHQAKDWFRMSMSANMARNSTNSMDATGSSTSNVWYSAEQMAPIYPIWVRDTDGKLVLDATGKAQFDYGINRASGAQQNFNSIATLYDDKYYGISDNVSGRSMIEFNTRDEKYGAFRGFSFAMNLGFDYVSSDGTTYYNPYFGNAGGTVKGRLGKSSNTTFSFTLNQILHWKRSFNEVHNFDVMVGHEFYHYKFNNLYAEKTGFPFGGLYELASGSTISDATSYEDNDVLESFFSRLNYDYAGKYYFSGSFRTDGSSHFKDIFRWGDFWSVGASWRISEENFIKPLTWVNSLSFKASYGTQGNNAIGLYAWQSFYDLTYNNAGLNGAVVTSLENQKVSWEKNANFNVGLDGKIFDRLTFGIEWYSRKTTDMLLYRPMATSLGFDGFYDNVGDMVNSGVEFSLAYDILKTKDLRWNVTFMGSTVKNKVLKLTAEQNEIVGGTTIIKVGETLNSFYLARSAGVDPANGNQLYWIFDKDADGNPGEPYISADKTKAAASRVILGSRIPDLYGSIGTSLSYKAFDFSFLTTYSIGGKMFDNVGYSYTNPLYIGNNFTRDVLRAWQEPGDITDVPRMQKDQVFTNTDRALIDASYFSIKNISLGYSFNNLKKLGLESIRIFVQGDNFYLFTHRQGLNPQFNFTGNTDYTYTPNKTISVGLNIKF